MRIRATVSVLLLLGAGAWAGSGAQHPMSDEDTLRSLDEQVRVAVLKRDSPALERLWSDHFTVTAPNNQVVKGKRAVLALVQQGLIHYSSFERTIEFIRVDGDIGIIMGAETVQPIGQAPLAGQTVRRRYTNVWKKEAGAWRTIARHANVIPGP